MHSFRVVLAVSFGLLFAILAPAQSAAPPVASVLQQSLNIQTGGIPINDLTLTGTISFPHSVQTGSFPVSLIVLANGTTQMTTNLPSGTVTHVWSNANGTPTLIITGPSGTKAHPVGQNTLMPAAAWVSPAVITNLVSGPAYTLSDTGPVTKGGVNLEHYVAVQPSSGSQVPPQIDIYIDPTSSLPLAVVFQVNPYSVPTQDQSAAPFSSTAPEEINFSDYRPTQGGMFPFHIQAYLGQVRLQIMDLTISSAFLNTGATISVPNATAN
jgi:hypothetical protein